MAGLLDKIARQVLNSFNSKKISNLKHKILLQTSYRPPSRTMPLSQTTRPVKLTIGMQKKLASQTSTNPLKHIKNPSVIITSEKEMISEYIIEKNIPENKSIDKEDYLLTQIDEFRAKAQQLQALLFTKESKVQELQELVDERRVEAMELEHLLGERQEKADSITEEVSKQINSLIDKVSEKLETIGVSLGKELQDGQKINKLQFEDLKDTFGVLNGHQMEEIKNMLDSLNVQQAEELKQALSELIVQLEKVKSDLSDKVHSENVQCYRNLASLLKNIESKLDKANEIEKKLLSVHKCTIAAIVLSLLNILGFVSWAFYELGFSQFLLK